MQKIMINALKVFIGTTLFWYFIWGPHWAVISMHFDVFSWLVLYMSPPFLWTGDVLDFKASIVYGIVSTVGYICIEFAVVILKKMGNLNL